MSYILDALNKAEQDRKRARAPGLDTMHRNTAKPTSTRRLVIAGIILLALINGGFLVYWFGAHQYSAAAIAHGAAAHTTATSTPSTATMAGGQSAAPVASAQASRGQRVTPQDALATTPANNGPRTAASEKPIGISDLPVSVQQQLPSMTFSSHIYDADDAKYRMVSINGKLLHEGDMVAPGIRLVHITEEGVVLTFQGYTFKVSVLHDWSFN